MKKGFLIVLMVFVFSLLPVNCLEAEAFWTSDRLVWYDVPSTAFFWEHKAPTIKIEEGTKFYVGDYAFFHKYMGTKKEIDGSTGYVYKSYTASMLKVKYKSSDKKVATVSSTGYFKAKKKGKTTITVTYKGHSAKMEFQVVGKGKLTKSKQVKRDVATLNSKIPKVPNKITEENGILYCDASFDISKVFWDWNSRTERVNDAGFLVEDNQATNKLVAPKAGRLHTISYMLEQYREKNDPEDPESSEAFKIKDMRIDSSEDKIIITLEKPISQKQYIALLADNLCYSPGQIRGARIGGGFIRVYDRTEKKNQFSLGGANVEVGADTIVLSATDGEYRDGVIWFYDADFIEGHKYQIGKKADWTKGKKVVAKDYSYSIYEEMEE